MKTLGDRMNTCELSTGRQFTANGLKIGLDVENLSVVEGWDGHIFMDKPDWAAPGEYDEEQWTVAEKMELADYMIEAWQRFKVMSQETGKDV